jgi:UDP-N-acetylglucosamine acyltransferase
MLINNHVVISNNVQIAGHVHVEDFVTMGGHTAIHHFVTVGRYAMLGGFSRVASDIPPYMISFGYPAEVRGVNQAGLKRWGLPEDDIAALGRAYKLLYAKRSEKTAPFMERLETLIQQNGYNQHVTYLCEFIQRTISVGNCGRYLESQRRDTPQDSQSFFAKRDA